MTISSNAIPIASERPDGTSCMTSMRRRARAGSGKTFWPTRLTSPPRAGVLLHRRELQGAEKDDLVLEPDAELLRGSASRLGHQGDRVGRPRSVRVLDEVRVTRRDLRAADAMPLEPAGLEHAARAELVLRVLEHAPVGPLVGGLSRLPPSL